jgi:apolipoprotein N-acyltransferase
MRINLVTSPKRLSLAILSGLLLFLSFPKYGNGLLAWGALIPLFFALKDVKPFEGFKIGFIAGFVAHVGIIYWIVYVVVQYGYLPIYVGIPVMLLVAAYLALYTACFALGIVFLHARGIRSFVSAPFLWTIFEYLRSRLLTGFPWENLAYSQYEFSRIIQLADITGIYGITFLIVLTNVTLYDILALGYRKRVLFAEVVTTSVLITVTLAYGDFRYDSVGKLLKSAPRFDVALIQGNIDQNIKWNSLYQSQTIDIYRSLSLSPSLSGCGLTVWPETAVPFYFQRPGPLQDALIDIAKQSGSALLFGSPSYGEEGGAMYYMNSAFLLGSDGTLSGRYDKVHLVPYGEYVPMRSYFPFIGKLVAGVGDFRSGNGFRPLTLQGRRIGVLICYEGIFPEAAGEYKKQKADFLVNITNDAWFGRTSAPYQHLSMTIFRAIENRLYLVRCANTGISAVIDPRGDILSRTGIFEKTTLRGQVRIIADSTFYAAYGDVFVYGCVIFSITLLYISNKQRRKENA